MADDIRNCGDLDEHLAPFVDGEEPPAGRATVAKHLDACPPCRQHADAERSARDIVREHRTALCAHAPDALRARCLQASGAGPASVIRRPSFVLRKWAPLSVAATLVLVMAGLFVTNRVEALAASLTADHVKCFKVSGTAGRADSTEAARKWQQDYGWPVAVPAAAPVDQLTLVDVRRCFSTDGSAAHIMYTWQGEPVSLFVLPRDTGRERIIRSMGHQAVIWCANQRTYAVVADDKSPQDLAPLVAYLKTTVQ